MSKRSTSQQVPKEMQAYGFIIDARYAPREIQEEAFRQGLIPYIPS